MTYPGAISLRDRHLAPLDGLGGGLEPYPREPGIPGGRKTSRKPDAYYSFSTKRANALAPMLLTDGRLDFPQDLLPLLEKNRTFTGRERARARKILIRAFDVERDLCGRPLAADFVEALHAVRALEEIQAVRRRFSDFHRKSGDLGDLLIVCRDNIELYEFKSGENASWHGDQRNRLRAAARLPYVKVHVWKGTLEGRRFVVNEEAP